MILRPLQQPVTIHTLGTRVFASFYALTYPAPLPHPQSLTLVETTQHVAVPFAEAADLSRVDLPKEVVWEGRIFDDRVVKHPLEYPKSRYKSLNVTPRLTKQAHAFSQCSLALDPSGW
jgi:hypothetical protein